MKSITKVVKMIDWDALYEQKMYLVEVISKLRSEISPDEDDSHMITALEGLVNLLDNLNDAAEEDKAWESPLAKF